MNFDIAIIGGGPAGYTAAERAGANGLRAWIASRVLPNMAFLPNLLRLI